MTTAGWIFMGVAWTAIIVVLTGCMSLVLGGKPKKRDGHEHGKHGPFNM